MGKVLYIGGFEMPDKNAAAQRVINVGKILRECGYDVLFYGITKSGDYAGNVENFEYQARDYPKSTHEWIKYACGDGITKFIHKKKPEVIITYNFPAIAQERIIRYCRRNGIKTIGDITEWYEPKDIIRKIDTFLRMRWSNWHLDGIIPISHYLYNYYKGKNLLELPPIVDKNDLKWQKNETRWEDGNIHLIYVGSTNAGKDRLDYILKGLEEVNSRRLILDVVGMTKVQYMTIYQTEFTLNDKTVVFHGRLPHQKAIHLLKQADFQIFFRNNTRVNNAGFPTKFVESVSAGTPVITNKISNIADYIDNNKNSFLIESPTQDNISRILYLVEKLTKEEIFLIKKNVDRNRFDYHQYIKQINQFILDISEK